MTTTPVLGRAAVVSGLGAWVPPRVVTNDDLAAVLDTSDEWIRTRTGITRRYRVDAGMATCHLAVEAGRRALRSAGGGTVDALVLATMSPDRLCPPTAPEVASRLGLVGAAAFDVGAACSGFVYGLAVASSLIRASLADRVLLIGADAFSTMVDPRDRTTAILFGDGAGAIVLRAGEADEPGTVGSFDLGSDGTGADLLAIPAGGSRQRFAQAAPGADQPSRDYFVRMSGNDIFRHAVLRMTGSARAALARAEWAADDVTWFATHQANLRIVNAAADRLGIEPGRRLANVDRVGNTCGASIPILLASSAALGLLKRSDRVLLSAFGAGLTWGSTALTWPEVTPCLDAIP